MTPDPHFSWLMGPTDHPDPRVGEMSASAAHRGPHNPVLNVWDGWLNQPASTIQAREEGAT